MKKEYFEKKRFHPFKMHLYQHGKPENMPVAAGRLIIYHNQLVVQLNLSLLAHNLDKDRMHFTINSATRSVRCTSNAAKFQLPLLN